MPETACSATRSAFPKKRRLKASIPSGERSLLLSKPNNELSNPRAYHRCDPAYYRTTHCLPKIEPALTWKKPGDQHLLVTDNRSYKEYKHHPFNNRILGRYRVIFRAHGD